MGKQEKVQRNTPPAQMQEEKEHSGKQMSPPALQLKAGADTPPIQRQTFGMGNKGGLGMFGDTRDLHRGVADNYRRWEGLPESGSPDFDHTGPSDFQITHMGALHRPPYTEPELAERLLSQMHRLAIAGDSLLRIEYIDQIIADRAKHSSVNTAFESVLKEAGIDSYETQNMVIERRAKEVLDRVEVVFINDPTMSSIDLLSADRAKHFKGIKWGHEDYPGGEKGKNEAQSVKLANELTALRPERRPNAGTDTVVHKSEFEKSSALRKFISDELRAVPEYSTTAPGQTTPPKQPKGHKLNRHAQEAFLLMREAALAEGVELVINSSYRTPETAKSNAEASGNSSAVASYSAHTLGLAFDLNMSFGTTKFLEDTTRPMSNVINMRTSPAHKWMFLKGAQYGFFPYQNEPWHWEYNPLGFREQFMEEYKASKGETGK